jgi:rhodanese-related sulfurtransferase
MESFDLTPEQFAEGMQTHPDAILLDVRTPGEFTGGHLPGAINVDIQGYDFHEQIENFDIDKTYYIYCRSGARSTAACKYMLSKGFQDVHNLAGGILAWNGEIQQP